MTVSEWRSRHKKCKYCRYSKYTHYILGGDYCECLIKDKAVFPSLPRPFCKVFKVRALTINGEGID
jgi:hypothetical protein